MQSNPNSPTSLRFEPHSSARIWQPATWRDHQVWQQADWGTSETAGILSEISRLPGLVGAAEIETLRAQIAEAGLGRRFLLQGGDCAERFKDCNEEAISSRLRLLLQMSLVIGYAAKKPIIRVGRMAGQYAKPRTDLTELLDDGLEIPAFRGENINGFQANPNSRRPDPARMIQAYNASSATLNFIRQLLANGFADLKHVGKWQMDSIKGSFAWARYERIAAGLRDALAFLECIHDPESLKHGFHEFFVSHEALILPYEESMTRFVPAYGRWYNLSTHMVWIGERTRQLDGGHVEYCRGIGNPVGVKISADSDERDIIQLVDKLNPHHEAGKIVLITRLGSERVHSKLPRLIEAVRAAGQSVTWIVDPMHGNTERTLDDRKTRDFAKISKEIEASFAVHHAHRSELGGVHLEMTHDDVTECIGGGIGLTGQDLERRYETWCDPRLNGSQSLELAFHIAGLLRRDV